MNRTLTELASANLNSQEIPEYLWEYAISHVTYIRNQAYTKPLGTLTPYQGWLNKKPNIAHLQEFGGSTHLYPFTRTKGATQDVTKSKRCIYVGYDDASNS